MNEIDARIQELSTSTNTLVEKAKSIIITTQDDYNMASDVLKAVKAQDKAIHEILDPKVDAAHKVHKAATAERTQYLEPLAFVEKTLKPLMSNYITKQEEIRRAAERKLLEEKLEADRKAAQEKAEKEALLKDLGMDQEAEAVALAPVVVQEYVAPPKVETNGISYREVWKFEITDLAALPREYMVPDETKIRGVVTSMKKDASIPGVRVYSEKSPVVR